MAFHGGFLGVLVALYLYTRRIGRDFWSTMDFIAPFVPFGLGAGRIGNFIGGELWGRPTDVPWGMVFYVDNLARASVTALPGAAGRGAAVCHCLVVLVTAASATGSFRSVCGLLRCVSFLREFFRQPDEQLGYLAFGWLTMGQLLSLPMIIAGAVLLYLAYTNQGRFSFSRA